MNGDLEGVFTINKEIEIRCKNGELFSIELPASCEMDSFFAFSLPKAGSTLLMNMLKEYCAELSIPVVEPYPIAFSNGIMTRNIGSDLDNALFEKGYAYLGFRHFLPYDTNFDFHNVRSILLVRDPRDMLTSAYFSVKYSHFIPDVKGSVNDKFTRDRNQAFLQSVDDFVISRQDRYLNMFMGYMEHLMKGFPLKIYRYEDVIFSKEEWLVSMVSYLGLELRLDDIGRIAKKHDIRPSVENRHAHVRQVTPGNYKSHLSDSTVDKLNKTFSGVLKEFKYDY